MSPPRKVAAKSKPSSPSSKAQRKEVEVEEEGETVEILSSTEPSKDVEMTPVELVGEGDEPKVELVAEEEEEPQEEVPAEIKNFEEDSRPRIGEIGKFGNFDATVDTYFGRGGLIGSNSTEGFQYLLSGARSSIGVKGGRGGGGGVFAFEMKIVEILTPMDAACNKQAYLPQNKHCVRVGFTTIDGSLLLGTDANGIAFDAGLGYDKVQGHLKHVGGRQFSNGPCVWKEMKMTYLDKADFGLDDVVTVVLNLSENVEDRHSNSIALFKNGLRVTEPIPIPDDLKGKDLYPTVTFKNVRIAVNLGHEMDGRRAAELAGLTQRLPFTCRSLQRSAAEDISISPYFSKRLKEPEVIMMVGLPDQGVFDFVDYFMRLHPYQYTEISDRTMFEWLKSSSLRPLRRGGEPSNDRPDYLFGIQPIDEGIIRSRIRDLASSPQDGRSIILVEIEGGLLKEERGKIMSKFMTHKRVARICVGEPDDGYQNYVRDLVRGEIESAKSAERERKLEELRREWKTRVVEKERQRRVKAAARAAERARKEAAAEARRKRKEAAMRAAAAKRAAEARKGDEPSAEDGSETKLADDVAMEMQEGEGDVSEEEHLVEVEEEEEEGDEPEPTLPEVEVTEDDLKKAMTGGYFRRQRLHDISSEKVSEAYLRFTLPHAEESFEDGQKVFDEVVYEWEKKEAAESKLDGWIRHRKVLEKVPTIMGPSEWFKVQLDAWSETKLEWRKKHRTYLQAVAMREAAAKKTEAEEVSKEDVKAEESKETNDGGNTGDYPGMDSNFVAREMFGLFPSEDTAVVESPLPEAPSQTTYIDPDAADIWAVEDINDLDGKGTPLYGKFQAEDWQLLNLRYELHLLCHAFFRDATAEDGDIKGIHRSLLQHYFSTYFVGHPPLIASLYGGKSVDELLDTFVVDTITVGSDGVLKTVHDIDTPQSTFVRLVESARRERQKRIEAGDESARIRIVQPVTAPRNSGGRGPTVRDNRNSGSRGGKGGVSHPGKYYGHHHQQQQQHPHNRYARVSQPSSPGSRGGHKGGRLPPGVYQYQHSAPAGGQQYGGRYLGVGPVSPSGYYGGQQQQQYNSGYKRGYESAGMYDYEAGKRQKGGGPPPGQYYQAPHGYGGQYYRQ